jgi:hypothetical protein
VAQEQLSVCACLTSCARSDLAGFLYRGDYIFRKRSNIDVFRKYEGFYVRGHAGVLGLPVDLQLLN